MTALDIKPMVPIRQKIYYLATNYFGITQATIDAAMAKARLTLEPESVKSRKVNLFKQVPKHGHFRKQNNGKKFALKIYVKIDIISRISWH